MYSLCGVPEAYCLPSCSIIVQRLAREIVIVVKEVLNEGREGKGGGAGGPRGVSEGDSLEICHINERKIS